MTNNKYNVGINYKLTFIKGVNSLKIHHINLNDYSDYDENLCNNGGHYGFWTRYTSIGNDKWEVSYHTTSDFPYCDVCGSFGEHDHAPWEYDVITTEELYSLVDNFKEDDDHFIEIITEERD